MTLSEVSKWLLKHWKNIKPSTCTLSIPVEDEEGKWTIEIVVRKTKPITIEDELKEQRY